MDETEFVPIHHPFDFEFEFVESHQDLVDKLDLMAGEIDNLKAEVRELRSQRAINVPSRSIPSVPSVLNLQGSQYNNWVEWFCHEVIP